MERYLYLCNGECKGEEVIEYFPIVDRNVVQHYNITQYILHDIY